MGLAISDNQRAVYSIGKIGSVTEVNVPKDPVWITHSSCDPRQAAQSASHSSRAGGRHG